MLHETNHKSAEHLSKIFLIILLTIILLAQYMIPRVSAEVTLESAGNANKLISAGDGNVLVVNADGTVTAWGNNDYNENIIPPGLNNVVMISAGEDHSVALKADGTVITWGRNTDGQCDVPDELTEATAISAGSFYTMALDANGQVFAWGHNSFGQSDVPSDLTDVIAISAGFTHSMTLDKNGKVFVWGNNINQQCDVPSGLSNVIAISAGGEFCMALKADRTVVVWGDNTYGQCSVPSDLSDVIAISAGDYHCMALKADGTVVTWGNNDGGQLDIPYGLSDVVGIAGGFLNSVALKADGSIVVWGWNNYQQCDVPNGTNLSGRYLNDILINNDTWDFNFDPNTLDYTIDVQNVVDNIDISPFADNDIRLEIQGIEKSSGSTTSIPLNLGETVIEVVGIDTHTELYCTYTLTINREALDNTNADLYKLETGTGVLSPVFDTDTTDYTVSVDNTIESIDITAQPEQSNATTTIDGQSVGSGEQTISVPLDIGINLISIEVRAGDNTTTKNYTLTVVRGSSDNADLSNLSVDVGNLNPAFDADTTAYTLHVDNSVSAVELTAETDDPRALMLINSMISDNSSKTISLNEGENTVKIMVVAQDASTKTYTISIYREKTITITDNDLPISMKGVAYNKTLNATGGDSNYIWSATGLPNWLNLSSDGILSGTPDAEGEHLIEITVNDGNNFTETKNLTLTVKTACGNGAYVIESDGNAAYNASYSKDGLLQLTVNKNVSGFTYFSVHISPVLGHSGTEVCVFVQTRNGVQLAIMAYKGDFENVGDPCSAFNVQPGDVIEVYVVDALSNEADKNPVVL